MCSHASGAFDFVGIIAEVGLRSERKQRGWEEASAALEAKTIASIKPGEVLGEVLMVLVMLVMLC